MGNFNPNALRDRGAGEGANMPPVGVQSPNPIHLNAVHLEFGAAAIGVPGMRHERSRRTDVNGCVAAANFGALTGTFMLSYMLS